MEDLIYSLNSNDGYSGEYYNRIKLVSKEIINSTIRWGEHYIKDFMKFIEDNKIEKIRSIEEYSIEFMLIGVIFQEYIDNARALKKIPITPIILLNNLKNKKERKEDKIAGIREWISNKILLRSKHQGDEYSYKDFLAIIRWLKATTGFKEEVLRLENWKEFFKKKNEIYINHVIGRAIDVSLDLNDVGVKFLDKYVDKLKKSDLEKLELMNHKEDFIHIHKGKMQYFFNMVSSEIMNEVYIEKYLQCLEKILLVPESMKQTKIKCCCLKTNNGYKCKKCSDNCKVNKLHMIGEERGVRVYSMENNNQIFGVQDRPKGSNAIIGITCSLKLMSIGWNAVRVGFTPQCILLENCKNSVEAIKHNQKKNTDSYKIIS